MVAQAITNGRIPARGLDGERILPGRPGLRGARKALLAFAAAVVLSTTAGVQAAPAETRVQTELDTFATLGWTGDELGLLSYARGQVDFLSPRGEPVQGRLQLRATLGDGQAPAGMPILRPALLEVPRANLRFRFPITEEYTMRVTAGRDRLTWGVGSLFNAGDLLYGADGTAAADFTDLDDPRDETSWLTAFYFPTGDLSYLETVMLPPLPELTFDGTPADDEDTDDGDTAGAGQPGAAGALADAPPLSETGAGVRFHTQLAGITLEPSYLYDGSVERHNIALAVQGGLGADLYAAARLSLDEDMPSDAATLIEERSTISAGAYYSFNIGPDRRLTGRLETLVNPGGDWEHRGRRDAEYGLLLYPELVYTPGRTVDVIARSVVSPIDRSALITGGVSWNIFSGFRAQAFAGVEAGDDDAVFGWNRPGSVRVSTGFNYRF